MPPNEDPGIVEQDDSHEKQPDFVQSTEAESESAANTGPSSWHFWAIFPALCLASLLIAVEATVLSTSLPTISTNLGSSESYIWAINAYVLSVTAVQPLCGQLANIYGRKATLIASWVVFIIGSGICGGAYNTAMLIAGRAVQGIGGAGLNILPSMVVCDLVSLRKRQLYQTLIYAAFAIGTFIGPVIGGALVHNWRWIFYLNIPLCAFGLALTVFFLRLHAGKPLKPSAKLKRLDFVGNTIFIAAMTSILLALSTARTPAQWRSWRVLLPLFLGFFGIGLFVLWERSPRCKEPTTPTRLFTNRTSAAAFVLTFLHGITMYWTCYFIPVYFQSVRLATPVQAGLGYLPSITPVVPFGILGAIMISKTGRFRENHIIGFVLLTIAAGCFSILDQTTSTAVWVILQLVNSAGAGFILTASLTAVQAPLPESDVAAAAATHGFVQSLGFVCGAAIPSNIFNTRFQQLLFVGVSDPQVRDVLSGGAAYESATRSFLLGLNADTRQEVINVIVNTLKLVWEVEVAFMGLGVLVSFLLKNVTLRTDLDTEYGYKERTKVDQNTEKQIVDVEGTTQVVQSSSKGMV